MLNRLTKLRDTEGFTLIELLIVVVIIGILAAIAIPQFSSTKEKAFDATAKSDLRNVMTAQEAHFADFNQYADGISTTEAGANSTTLFFNPSSGLTSGGGTVDGLPGIQVTATANPAGGYLASARHPGSNQCFGVEVGDGDGDGTQGSGEISAGGGSCP